jgi:ribosomal protein S18 acetylase RimI-like enzyme
LEIVLDENKGIGTALIDAVISVCKESECDALWLSTTNESTGAIHFYQKREFDLAAVHFNVFYEARRLKPSIPLVTSNGIPIKNAFKF